MYYSVLHIFYDNDTESGLAAETYFTGTKEECQNWMDTNCTIVTDENGYKHYMLDGNELELYY